MLTREGFVAADMSGHSALQRSSWKADAIRRGDLKISGPIPITEDMPLNDEEEREFEEKGTLAPPPPQLEHEQDTQRPQTPPQVPHFGTAPLTKRMSLTSHPVDGQDFQRRDVQIRQPSRSPPRILQVSDVARESVAHTASYPSPTPIRPSPENVTKAAQKQKKRKSGFRGVFRKMFGRKSKDDDYVEEPQRRGHSYHHSDPGMLRKSPPRGFATTGGPRVSGEPVEAVPPHPLQQLPFPMNVNAPQMTPPSDDLNFKMGSLQRRATLGSMPTRDFERHSIDEPRLTTWGEQHDEDTAPSPGIGIALSGPPQEGTSVAQRRRSRSAGALRDLVKERASIDRRRSAEIRYWRQSYASTSPYSRPRTAKTIDTVRSVQQREPVITEPEFPAPEMTATMGHADEPSPMPEEHGVQEIEREVQPSVLAFNFGLESELLDDTIPPSTPDMATPPIPQQSPKRFSIEDRLTHLEGNFQSLELNMRRMSSRNNRQTIVLSDPPRNLRSRGTQDSSSQSVSGRSERGPVYQSSNDTLNPGPTSPILLRPNPIDSSEASKQEIFEKLCEALKYERTARKALEQQVQSLQHDIGDLHILVNKLIASATATSPLYPTPSPDAVIIQSTEDRMISSTPLAQMPRNEIRESIISKFSGTDSSACPSRPYSYDNKATEANWKNSAEDVQSPEVWATPKEEGFGGGVGFFNGEQAGVMQRSRSDLRAF